jgi:hypothetical protein
MNDVVHEWVAKAEADYHSALREYARASIRTATGCAREVVPPA